MTELELRGTAALTAAKWLGTKEGSEDHKAILAIYNSIVPLPRGYAMTVKDDWCAAFVSAAAVEAGMGERYPLECSCSRIIEKAKEMGIWIEKDDHRPKMGDWVLYNWQSAATGDDTGAPDHVGVIVGMEGGMLLAAEGNYDNCVKLRRFPVNYERIRGFVCPVMDGEDGRYHTLSQVPEYARATIEKLTSDGSIQGITEDDLGLTEELSRILVILDRRGVF